MFSRLGKCFGISSDGDGKEGELDDGINDACCSGADGDERMMGKPPPY